MAGVADHCTLWPEGAWAHCCASHDRAYDLGLDRLTADLDLATCVAGTGHPLIAALMLAGVTLFGGAFWLRSWWRRRSTDIPQPFYSPTLAPGFLIRAGRFPGITRRIPMTVRAKMKAFAVTPMHSGNPAERVAEIRLMAAVADGSAENKSWSKATPSGEVRLFITVPEAIDTFEPGKSYYVDFTPAD